jgi:hypothetical protein
MGKTKRNVSKKNVLDGLPIGIHESILQRTHPSHSCLSFFELILF